MRTGHSALSAFFHAACTNSNLQLNYPAWPWCAQVCPVKRRHLILGILLHLRRNAHSSFVVPLAQALLLAQLPFQLPNVLAPLTAELLPLLPLQRMSHITSQRHAAYACPVIGMSCSCKCRSTEQSLPLHCCSTSVKASLMRPCLVQQSDLRLILCKTLADVLNLHSCQTGYSAHQPQQCFLGKSKLS